MNNKYLGTPGFTEIPVLPSGGFASRIHHTLQAYNDFIIDVNSGNNKKIKDTKRNYRIFHGK